MSAIQRLNDLRPDIVAEGPEIDNALGILSAAPEIRTVGAFREVPALFASGEVTPENTSARIERLATPASMGGHLHEIASRHAV